MGDSLPGHSASSQGRTMVSSRCYLRGAKSEEEKGKRGQPKPGHGVQAVVIEANAVLDPYSRHPLWVVEERIDIEQVEVAGVVDRDVGDDECNENSNSQLRPTR